MNRHPTRGPYENGALIGDGSRLRLAKGRGFESRFRQSPSVSAALLDDLFEALTACDRPYKKAKPLSESIRILARLRDRGHIDADLFALFLSSGLHLSYGHRHLKPEQLDQVDISEFLQRPTAAAS